MLGPRYPHRWSTTCEDYGRFWLIFENSAIVPPTFPDGKDKREVTGSGGPQGTPTVVSCVADDPKDARAGVVEAAVRAGLLAKDAPAAWRASRWSSHGRKPGTGERVTNVERAACSATSVCVTCLMSSRPSGTPRRPTKGDEIE